MDWYWWVAIVFGLIAIEAITLDLVLFMFAGGAVGAAVAAALGGDVVWQVAVFAILSALLLVALRPYLLKNLRVRGEDLVETNVAAHVGRDAVVVQTVTESGGLVKLMGEVWTARTEGPALQVGAEVQVLRIDGATAVVAPQEADHASGV